MVSAIVYTIDQIPRFYDNLTLHIVPGPRSLKYFLPFLLLYGCLLCPTVLKQSSRRTVAVLVIIVVQSYVWHTDSSFDVISMNAVLSAFMLLGWYDIRRDFRQVKSHTSTTRASSGKVSTESYPDSLRLRVFWLFDLLSAIRFTGWHTPANARRKLPTSPWRDSVGSFYWTTVLKAICHYCILDLTSSYISKSSSFVKNASNGPSTWQVEMFILLAHVYAALAFYNAFLPIALSVVLAPFPGLVNNPSISPLCWPAHFGPISAIWTADRRKCGLRAFWGTFWHQNMRYITSTPGIAMAWLLGCRPGTIFRYLLVVTISFFFSGIVHMGVVPPYPLRTERSCWQLRLQLATFFWIQPIGICLESLLFIFARGPVTGGSKVAHVTVTIWTACFLAISMWYTIRPVGKELDWWSVYLVPFSMLSLIRI